MAIEIYTKLINEHDKKWHTLRDIINSTLQSADIITDALDSYEDEVTQLEEKIEKLEEDVSNKDGMIEDLNNEIDYLKSTIYMYEKQDIESNKKYL